MTNPDVSELKATLASEIIKTLDKGGLTVRRAQNLTGIDAGDFSRVRNGDFRRISVERLMAMINGLGARVEVRIVVRRSGKTARRHPAPLLIRRHEHFANRGRVMLLKCRKQPLPFPRLSFRGLTAGVPAR